MKKILILIAMACTTMWAWADAISTPSYDDDAYYFECQIIEGTNVYVETIRYNKEVASVTIPASFEKDATTYTVKKVGKPDHSYFNFWGDKSDKKVSITTLTLSEGIEEIYENCFNGWTGLTAINLPASLTKVESHAFEGCTAVMSITLKSVPNNVEWGFHKLLGTDAQTFNSGTTIYCPLNVVNGLSNSTDGKFKDYGGSPTYRLINVVLDEGTDLQANGAINLQVSGDITVKRTMHAGYWNTICLPFDMDWSDMDTNLGIGWKLCTFAGCTDNTMKFTQKTEGTIDKNVPYLLWVPTGSDKTELSFTKEPYINIWSGTYDPKTEQGEYKMIGNMNGDNQKVPNGALFINNDKVYRSKGNSPMKAMSAYFEVPSGASARSFTFSVDGKATGIISIEKDGSINVEETIYDLQGRKVSNPKHGLYIINGKKIMK